MSRDKGADMAAAAAGGRAQELLEYSRVHLDQRRHDIERDIFALLDKKEPLDPSVAVQSWIALHEAKKLVKGLETLAKRGREAGERIARGEQEG